MNGEFLEILEVLYALPPPLVEDKEGYDADEEDEQHDEWNDGLVKLHRELKMMRGAECPHF